MKKSFILSAAAAALMLSGGAKAADIVTYQQTPAAAPAAPAQVNWNGFYVGGTIGGSWANAKNKVRDDWYDNELRDGRAYNSAGKMQLFNKKVDPSSFIGGIYAGYNFQPGFLSETALKDVVFGIETDWLWNTGDSSAKGTSELSSYDIQDNNIHPGWDGDMYKGMRINYKTGVRQEWNGATRLRAGYALGSEGRILPYIAGGVSYAKISAKSYAIEIDDEDSDERDSWRTFKSTTRAGWNIGAGIDYVPPVLSDHLILRAEYRFTGFGTAKFKQSGSVAYDDSPGNGDYAGDTVRQRVKFNQNDFRVGIAYKF